VWFPPTLKSDLKSFSNFIITGEKMIIKNYIKNLLLWEYDITDFKKKSLFKLRGGCTERYNRFLIMQFKII